MSSLPARIHDDAERAAAGITREDVPPLRLPGPDGRLSHRRSPRGRRWLAPLAAAVSVAAIITAVAVVGRAGAGHPAATSPATARPGPGPTISGRQRAGEQLATEAVDSFFPATGAQYTEGLAYGWTQAKVSTQRYGSCMARAGYPQPPFTEPERSYLLSFPDNSQFPDLAQRAATRSMTGLTYIAPAQTRPRSAAGRAALARCQAAAGQPFAAITRIATPLETQWEDDITAIQTSAAARATQPSFGTCLEAHGVPAGYARQRVSGSNPLFAGFFAWMDRLVQTASSPRQQASDERRWTPVFVTCAQGTVATVQRLQLARQAGFFRQHARQVQEIRALARALPGGGW